MKKGNKEGSVLEFVVPRKYRAQVLKASHDDVGHASAWECTRLLRNRFYWANVDQDMEQHMRGCEKCLKSKVKQKMTNRGDIPVSYPMELVHIDYLSIPNKSDKNVNILVVTDYFTRLA